MDLHEFERRMLRFVGIYVVWAVFVIMMIYTDTLEMMGDDNHLLFKVVIIGAGVLLGCVTARDVAYIRSHCEDWGEVFVFIAYVSLISFATSAFVQAIVFHDVEQLQVFVMLYLVLVGFGAVGPPSVVRLAAHMENIIFCTPSTPPPPAPTSPV